MHFFPVSVQKCDGSDAACGVALSLLMIPLQQGNFNAHFPLRYTAPLSSGAVWGLLSFTGGDL